MARAGGFCVVAEGGEIVVTEVTATGSGSGLSTMTDWGLVVSELIHYARSFLMVRTRTLGDHPFPRLDESQTHRGRLTLTGKLFWIIHHFAQSVN